MTQTIEQENQTASTIAAVEAFQEAINRHDVDAAVAHMTDDVIFETTLPPPDGERFEGQASVRAFWGRFFKAARDQRFATEEIFAHGDRCTVRWLYTWTGLDGKPGHVRGADVFRMRDGKVAEKLSYVKG